MYSDILLDTACILDKPLPISVEVLLSLDIVSNVEVQVLTSPNCGCGYY